MSEKRQTKAIQRDFAKVHRDTRQAVRDTMKNHNVYSFHLDKTHLYEYLNALLREAEEGNYPSCNRLLTRTSCPIAYRKKAAVKSHKLGLKELRDQTLKKPLVQGLDGALRILESTWNRWAGMSLAGFTKELQGRFKLKAERDTSTAKHQDEIRLLETRIRQLEAEKTGTPMDFKGTRIEQINGLKRLGWTIKRIADHLAVSPSTVKRELSKIEQRSA